MAKPPDPWSRGRITGGRCRTWSSRARAIYYAVIPLLGVAVGYWVALGFLASPAGRTSMFTPSRIASIVALSILISGILAAILSAREKAARRDASLAAERARVATAERAAALAQLQALEAQVEPHFLYNTLAHVASLIDREPATAKRMLDRLIVLLRASAAGGANGGSTLGEQAAHMRAYL
ncbi:MAG: histidine kinase, partial [Burkholderiales bacterium]|nr:histidine kinase [Burkholderiales bacterium]